PTKLAAVVIFRPFQRLWGRKSAAPPTELAAVVIFRPFQALLGRKNFPLYYFPGNYSFCKWIV
ncbi:MAG: hypothetical protein IKY41_02930, partial [Clostridia bacterium]|nr:hypothetical protein [Clostridia bacterium]